MRRARALEVAISRYDPNSHDFVENVGCSFDVNRLEKQPFVVPRAFTNRNNSFESLKYLTSVSLRDH